MDKTDKIIWLLLIGMYETMYLGHQKIPNEYLRINSKQVLRIWYQKRKSNEKI